MTMIIMNNAIDALQWTMETCLFNLGLWGDSLGNVLNGLAVVLQIFIIFFLAIYLHIKVFPLEPRIKNNQGYPQDNKNGNDHGNGNSRLTHPSIWEAAYWQPAPVTLIERLRFVQELHYHYPSCGPIRAELQLLDHVVRNGGTVINLNKFCREQLLDRLRIAQAIAAYCTNQQSDHPENNNEKNVRILEFYVKEEQDITRMLGSILPGETGFLEVGWPRIEAPFRPQPISSKKNNNNRNDNFANRGEYQKQIWVPPPPHRTRLEMPPSPPPRPVSLPTITPELAARMKAHQEEMQRRQEEEEILQRRIRHHHRYHDVYAPAKRDFPTINPYAFPLMKAKMEYEEFLRPYMVREFHEILYPPSRQ